MTFSDYRKLNINGAQLEENEIIAYCRQQEKANLRLLGEFMEQWLNIDPYMKVQTSGSTGKPKEWRVKKDQMLQSAARTAKYFDFQPGNTVLLCLPMHYIAGKMMVVRALFSQLSLYTVEPSNRPFQEISKKQKIDFVPLVPTQLEGSKNLNNVQKILLGGGVVNPSLEQSLQMETSEIYHGYGMTETLSHIALRRVNGRERSEAYKVLEGIDIGVDERSCLTISSSTFDRDIQTNDVIELIDPTHFIWKGRKDFVINSGGIKFSPEEIEQKIQSLLSQPFFIAGLPDKKLGEKVCLFIEGEEPDLKIKNLLIEKIARQLKKYEKPRAVFYIKKFERTSSGKIKRKATIEANI